MCNQSVSIITYRYFHFTVTDLSTTERSVSPPRHHRDTISPPKRQNLLPKQPSPTTQLTKSTTVATTQSPPQWQSPKMPGQLSSNRVGPRPLASLEPDSEEERRVLASNEAYSDSDSDSDSDEEMVENIDEEDKEDVEDDMAEEIDEVNEDSGEHQQIDQAPAEQIDQAPAEQIDQAPAEQMDEASDEEYVYDEQSTSIAQLERMRAEIQERQMVAEEGIVTILEEIVARSVARRPGASSHCRYYLELNGGYCHQGDRCRFVHDPAMRERARRIRSWRRRRG